MLQHYRYDPERRERRHVTLAAFDNEEEFMQSVEDARVVLKDRQDAGIAEPVEHITGVVKPAGSTAKARQQRIEWKLRRGRFQSSR